MTTYDDPYAWPEPTHVVALRDAIARVTDLCAHYREKDGRIPCALVEKALDTDFHHHQGATTA